MSSTEFRDTFKGKREEAVDKVYFRKADWISKYSEAIQRSKILIQKK